MNCRLPLAWVTSMVSCGIPPLVREAFFLGLKEGVTSLISGVDVTVWAEFR